jgi:membrane protein implicated in regulation of membrane protease activity
MWLVYLIAMILGGGVLLIQVISGKDHDPTHFDSDLGIAHVPGPSLLSTRSLVYGLFTFGFVGAALHIPGLTSTGTALALALISGAVAGLAASYAFQVAGDPEAAGGARFEEAKGRKARVLVSCTPDRRGKIRVSLKGHQVDMMALSEGGGEIPEGREVVIVDVRDDIARVAEAK